MGTGELNSWCVLTEGTARTGQYLVVGVGNSVSFSQFVSMAPSPMMRALATPSPVTTDTVRSSRSGVKAVAIPAVHNAAPVELIADAAVYYIEQNTVLKFMSSCRANSPVWPKPVLGAAEVCLQHVYR